MRALAYPQQQLAVILIAGAIIAGALAALHDAFQIIDHQQAARAPQILEQ